MEMRSPKILSGFDFVYHGRHFFSAVKANGDRQSRQRLKQPNEVVIWIAKINGFKAVVRIARRCSD
jgi:hypothetical protein